MEEKTAPWVRAAAATALAEPKEEGGPTNALLVLDFDETLVGVSNDARSAGSKLRFWPPDVSAATTAFGEEEGDEQYDSSCYALLVEDQVVFERPGLAAFLTHVFSRFRYVGIWSRADRSWVRSVLEASPVLGPYRERFAFVWGAERCARSFPMRLLEHLSSHVVHKPLLKIWRRAVWRARGITKRNTLIVDDTPENAINNYGNLVPLPPFEPVGSDHPSITSDGDVLLGLREFLDVLLDDALAVSGTVRHTEKRGWRGVRGKDLC